MNDKLIKHGGIIFSASLLTFFFGYLFHFYMARELGPENYGILGTMLSLLYILTVPSIVITNTLAHIISEKKGKEDSGAISAIFLISLKMMVYIGLIIFFLLVILSPIIKNILNLSSEIPIITLGFSLMFLNIIPSPRGVLQGTQDFKNLGFNIAMEKPLLLFFGGIFIFFGMGVNGALLAYGVSSIVVLISGLVSLRSFLKTGHRKIDVSIYKYSLPIFILILCITIMSSIDILFVRRYFPAETSGYFNTMKMMGEMIYFLSISLGGVLLPKVSDLKTLNMVHSFLLKKTLFYFGAFIVAVLSAYALAPEMIITILFGKGYSSISQYLVSYTFTMGLLSLSVIIMFYDVSVKKTSFEIPLIIFTLVEIFLLTLFHETIGMIIAAQTATFIGLLLTVTIINRKLGTV